MQPGPAGRHADSVYDRNAPGFRDGMEAYVSGSGFSSNEERLVTEALRAVTDIDPDQLRAMRPAVAATPLFPPRFGYRIGQPTIDDVVQVDRRYPDSSAALSGSSGGYSGSSTPSLGWW